MQNDAYDKGHSDGFQLSEEGKKVWKCWTISYCPWRDWRYTKASDVCTFEWVEIKAKQAPYGKTGESWHGQHCLEARP